VLKRIVMSRGNGEFGGAADGSGRGGGLDWEGPAWEDIAMK